MEIAKSGSKKTKNTKPMFFCANAIFSQARRGYTTSNNTLIIRRRVLTRTGAVTTQNARIFMYECLSLGRVGRVGTVRCAVRAAVAAQVGRKIAASRSE